MKIEPLASNSIRRPSIAALTEQLHASQRGQMLAELLADVETDPDDLVRLRLVAALREVLG